MTQQFSKDGRSPWDSPAKRLWKKTRPSRLTTSLVGLSSAAIVSVYAVGYFNTQAWEGELVAAISAPSDSVAAAATATASGATSASPQQRVAQGGTAESTPQAPVSGAPAATGGSTAGASSIVAGFKDGTYVGSGTSRHGSIQATVVVSGGKIVAADVTSCGTRYPCSKISSLTARVVASQAAPTTYVSGATESSQAYTAAIKTALAQARLA